MSRINTNVSSLIAQTRLSRSQNQLQESLTRLSTGLRINSGKDDPAGLIASETLRADITSTNKAITNSERANQLLSTADSALGQISNLLNDIRGLVVEAANEGVLSDDQIAANQLQVDSSLEAIDRIAQVTTFQGRKLLDGSLDFLTNVTSGGSTISDLNIQQANLGASGQVNVSVNVTAAAQQALITNTAVNFSAGVKAAGTITFSDVTTPATQADGTITLTNSSASLDIAAVAGGAADGTVGNTTDFVFVAGGSTGAAYDAGTNQVTVTVAGGATLAQVETAMNTDLAGIFTTTLTGTGGDPFDSGDLTTYANALTNAGANAVTANDVITITSDSTGTAYNGTLTFARSNSVASGAVDVQTSGSNITVTVNDNSTYDLSDLTDAIQSQLSGYTVALTGTAGDNSFNSATDFSNVTEANLSGGTNDGGTGLGADLVFKLSGSKGAEVFDFNAGSTMSEIVTAINLVSDATGVQATNNSGTLELRSAEYGSSAYVDVEVISEGAGGTFESTLSSNRDTGTDIESTVNGIQAKGKGNTLSLNTASLDLNLTVTAGSSTDITFSINGGGATFQLGPEVVSNQQARIGISSVNTAKLGGVSGRLYELRSGNAADLSTDTTGAANIVDEVITKVTELRGRLGAFQRTTLETNIASLNDTLSNLTAAESSIRDADFAAESAKLTRAQILTQAGTSVLQIANQNPQSVLSLLRG